MTRQDDELVRRYHEASEQEGARPGAHVREAVRAHAQMVAKAATSVSAAPVTAPAANQARWKISALATLAVVGLTGLLMLQFERGTPEERDTAFSHRRPRHRRRQLLHRKPLRRRSHRLSLHQPLRARPIARRTMRGTAPARRLTPCPPSPPR